MHIKLNHTAGVRGEKQHPITLHKRVVAKGLRLMDDHWKHASTIARSPSAIFGSSPKEINSRVKANVPGPGHYGFQRPIRQENYSGFKLTRFNTDPQGNLSQHIQQIPKRSRKNSVSVCINESKHYIRDYFHAEAHQGITFPKETRETLEKISNKDKNQSPGPGKYNQLHRKSSKNMFSFSKSKKFCEEEKQLSQKGSIPAPGKYELSQSSKRLKGSKFTQALRMVTEPKSSLGPGSHSALTESSLSHQGGTIDRQRKANYYETGTPGPGKYEKIDINKTKRKQATAVIGKSTAESIKETSLKVGPGYYFKDKLFKRQKIPGGTIDRSLRNSCNSEMGPGPQDYSVNFAPVLSKSKQIIFCKQQQFSNPKKVYSRQIKESSLINDLRLSSNVNYRPLNVKKQDRQISKTTIGHY